MRDGAGLREVVSDAIQMQLNRQHGRARKLIIPSALEG